MPVELWCMSRSIRIALIVLILAVVGSACWWRLWMYQGIFGPINIISSFVVLDGEAAYDLVFIEMFVQLATLKALLVLVVDKCRVKK